MRLSKLTEHIGHGTHMFHVTVDSELTDLPAMHYMVAADSNDGAIRTAVAHRYGVSERTVERLNAMVTACDLSKAYEIGEIEP